jgi:hypothetical protein
MPTTGKTGAELQDLIMAGIQDNPECQDITGVAIDAEDGPNWKLKAVVRDGVQAASLGPVDDVAARLRQQYHLSDMTDNLFIRAGMDYYVAGRYAVFAGLNPTAASLLHHAVEMTLKGALAKKGMGLRALRGISHDVPRIWREFTARYGIYGNTFGGVIDELQKFESIRYPDEIVKKGLKSEIGRGKRPSPLSGDTTHALWLGEIDELMDKIFTDGSISHSAFVGCLHMPEAKEYLFKENEVAAA